MGMLNGLAGAAGIRLAEAEGFGLNLDILETNVINLAIVVALVVYFGRGFLGGILEKRKDAIASEIKEAEERQKKASAQLAQEKEKLAQAQEEAKRILANAAESAKTTKEQILAQGKQEIERMKASASQDTTSSEERAMAELRQRVAELALKKVEGELESRLGNDSDAQSKLIDRSISLLGGS
ncbi:ATP synthase subunit b [Acaryochloris thomasi RCC1774]|uniref:ATP synthase subunit b n=1 Tax=Acaryochloris thomasi RCC1774 TaxID=1764569 RepID=A0A2W1K4U8_9CYAN|nr:F0F1 ATP synthase subunit B [Acaryochloris thomasi]PZD74807.1 ATP synthase subunit b [Acaryochloris thomasi RCC1774]